MATSPPSPPPSVAATMSAPEQSEEAKRKAALGRSVAARVGPWCDLAAEQLPYMVAALVAENAEIKEVLRAQQAQIAQMQTQQAQIMAALGQRRTAAQMRAAGYTASNLKCQGYTAKECKVSAPACRSAALSCGPMVLLPAAGVRGPRRGVAWCRVGAARRVSRVIAQPQCAWGGGEPGRLRLLRVGRGGSPRWGRVAVGLALDRTRDFRQKTAR